MTVYPTYADFVAALVAGTLPIDLNGINAAGWTQQGTALNKANLLTDATAAKFGLTGTAVINDVLDNIGDNKLLIATGEYTGAGTSGAGNENTLTLGFKPLYLLVKPAAETTTNSDFTFMEVIGNPSVFYAAVYAGNTNPNYPNNFTWSNTGVTWYNSGGSSAEYYQMNNAQKYKYLAIGQGVSA